MKIKGFRIRHYKSIVDSGKCFLASDLTTLAGKNESGKTAALEALRDFDKSSQLSGAATPLSEAGDPEVSIFFSLTDQELASIALETGLIMSKASRAFIAQHGVGVTKDSEHQYSLGAELAKLLDAELEVAVARATTVVERQLTDTIFESRGPLPSFSATNSYTEQLVRLKKLASARRKQLAELPAEFHEQATSILKTVDGIIAELPDAPASDSLLDSILDNLPQFIFFSDFENLLPHEVSVSESVTHPAVQDFAKNAGLDLAKLAATTDPQRRVNILARHSATISGDFGDHWQQDRVSLEAATDGERLRFWVKEETSTERYKVDQRSRGFQWFLSFYMRLKAEGARAPVVLIDEPGLYLHAKAQQDVLRVLEGISATSQVVFSTHSPYLIDADRLDRVRLVINDRNAQPRVGTRIENKIHKSADIETITPIITALGLDVSRSFAGFKDNNVLTEGISDYYYLHAMRLLLHEKAKLNIVGCVGATKVPQMASLLLGWDLNFVAVLDGDKEGKAVARELRDRLLVDDDRILQVEPEHGTSTEDLFSKADFERYVLPDKVERTDSTSNSRLIKHQDKPLMARAFFDRVRVQPKLKVEDETVRNFAALFKRMAVGLKARD